MELVREMSEQTQFLVVTHNKQTMAIVDRLIGITMQERGVSTALEVRFEEAEAELDKWISVQ
jgi:chromosome segregation protein